LFRRWRRKKVGGREFPAEWLSIIQRNVPYYRRLTEAATRELQRDILIFLSEKRFVGCRDLEITDEIKVTIAAQACILLLGRQTDYYPGLRTILVYPEAYVAKTRRYLGAGLIAEGPEVRLGESWRRGSVVLSWDDVRRGVSDASDGDNVVFHEFAHQLDSSGGRGDSSEVLRRRSAFIAWARVLHKSFEKLKRDVGRSRPTILRAYGASSPAEFFAVATESFFERPNELKKKEPQLYNELKNFYHQDPAAPED